MTDQTFRQLVTQMRKAQKSYFSTRSRQALELSKKLEREVDNALINTPEHQTALDFQKTSNYE